MYRIACSESFRCAPAAVREWPARDLVHALLLLEMRDDMHTEDEERRKAGSPAGVR